MIFDTHSHYNDKQFDADRAVVLESLKDAGVTQVVNVSASWKDLMDTLELISKVPFMYGAAGIHPDHVGELNEERMEQLREYCHRDKIVAVGEIGLECRAKRSTAGVVYQTASSCNRGKTSCNYT